MKLRDYLNSIDMSTDEFGGIIGVSGQSVRRWTGGVAFPTYPHLQRIIVATSGYVNLQDFIDLPGGTDAEANVRRQVQT
jgi:hypothetical protein